MTRAMQPGRSRSSLEPTRGSTPRAPFAATQLGAAASTATGAASEPLSALMGAADASREATRWQRYGTCIGELLGLLRVTDGGGTELPPETAFRRWLDWTLAVRTRGGSVFLVGNGASASMASHIAADVAKGARVRAQVFTDPSLATAVANDIGYEEVFAAPLGWSLRREDVLVAVSSSGNSPNVLRATEVAHELGGHVVTLSGMSETNALRARGSLNFWVPAATYGLAETTHTAILHFWVDRLLES